MRHKSKLKGFSLVEALVSMFVFVIIILVSVMAFANANIARKEVRSQQQNLEDASYAMQLMEKTIRMNNAIEASGSHQVDLYSSSENMCVRYRFSDRTLREAKCAPGDNGDPANPDPQSCITSSPCDSNYRDIVINGLSDMNFSVVPTTDTVIGRITINMLVGNTWLENSTSFRDYSFL